MGLGQAGSSVTVYIICQCSNLLLTFTNCPIPWSKQSAVCNDPGLWTLTTDTSLWPLSELLVQERSLVGSRKWSELTVRQSPDTKSVVSLNEVIQMPGLLHTAHVSTLPLTRALNCGPLSGVLLLELSTKFRGIQDFFVESTYYSAVTLKNLFRHHPKWPINTISRHKILMFVSGKPGEGPVVGTSSKYYF